MDKPEIPIVDHVKPDGSNWTIKEKLLLGLSVQDYKAMILRNKINWVLFALLAIGLPLIMQRFIFGLATVTHASNDYPWGLFLGFGLFGMVPLSASGFLLGTTVELFGRKDFHPVERLALLNGLLGYLFGVIYLLVDLGMPWRLYYAMFVSLGPAAVLFLVAGLMGLIYGITVGKYKNDSDVMKGMAESMKSLAAYLVLVFFAAQFVAYFNWSNLGIILAIKGADFINSLNVGLIPLVILFVIFAGIVNLVMGSASAKWALMAPIFVPMFMFLGYTPELTQVVYRIGDSVTNIISPMMSFFALIIVYFQKYDNKAGIGTLVATMLPYTIVFLIGWLILLIIWLLMGWNLGPGAPIHL